MNLHSYSIKKCAIVVLAAGKSSRLGSPKQLLVYKGKSLVLYAVEIALQTGLRPVIVVVGANAEVIKNELKGEQVQVVENEGWKEGMASSLRSGLTIAQQSEFHPDGVIFMVCDQPHVSVSLLGELVRVQAETGLPMVASSYEGHLGTPALFHKSLFAELMELKGEAGARKLIKRHENLVASVPFPKGIVDIDTMADYEALKQGSV